MPDFLPSPPRHLGLRLKLGVLLGGCVVVTATLVGLHTYRQASQALVQGALAEVDSIAHAAAGDLRRGLQSQCQDAEILAAMPALIEVLECSPEADVAARSTVPCNASQEFEGVARQLLSFHPAYLSVALLGPELRPLACVARDPAAPAAAEATSFEVPEALPSGQRTVLSPVRVVRDANARRTTVQAWSRVTGRDGTDAGYLVLEADLAPLLASLAASIPGGRDLVVVDPAGRFLVHPDPIQVEDGRGSWISLSASLPGMAEVMTGAGASSGPVVQTNPDGSRVAASLERIHLEGVGGNADFGLGVLEPYDLVVAQARVVREHVVLTVVILVGLALALSWRLAQHMAGPLDRIAAAIRDFGSGAGEVKLPVDAPGEAGMVARAVDTMARQVEDRTRLLQAEVESHRATAQALRGSETRFRTFYDDSPAMFFTTDTAGRICSANRYGAERLGYRPVDLEGRPIAELFPAPERAEAEDFLGRALNAAAGPCERESRMLRRDGSSIWVRTVCLAMDEGGQDGRQLLWVGEDTTRANELSQDLSFREHHDTLTALPNRREMQRRLQILIELAAEKGSEHALCLLDLDQFKVVNDTCGHAAGDELLRQVARVLDAHVDPPDLLARLGGDEFALLLKDCPLHHAVARIEGLRAALHTLHFSWEGQRFEVTASAGMTPIRGTEHSVGSAMSLADTLCFAAKEAGRDRLHVYDAADTDLEHIQEQMKAVSMITKAFEESRFRLYRQPIVPVFGDEGGDHFEILIRMIDEDGKVLPPGVFLQSAERYGLAGRIDRWVVGTTLGWLRRNRDQLNRLAMCSINLSGQSLGDAELLAFIDHQLADGIIPPAKICFEITETVAVANMRTAIEFIQTLKKRGCLFALDDFGSGLSSFAYLRNLPVDLLKIDGMFVRDIATDATAFAMVKSIHEVAQVMGMRTVAEFVENDRILAKLGYIGVDYAQGYGISAPRPIDEPLFDALPAHVPQSRRLGAA